MSSFAEKSLAQLIDCVHELTAVEPGVASGHQSQVCEQRSKDVVLEVVETVDLCFRAELFHGQGEVCQGT